MKKTIIFLALVLAAQVGLGIALNLNRQQMAVFQPTASLLSFDRNAVDRITISGPEAKQVRLVKKDGRWILPDAFDFPAGQDAVTKLLTTLAGLKEGWPVAISKGAEARFKVGRNDFERHIVLGSGDTVVADLYVGTSPGFRKVHVRVAGKNEILAVQFSAYEAGDAPDDWLDRNYLHLDEKNITGISLPGIDLVRKDGHLVLADLDREESMNKEAVKSLVTKVANLDLESVLGREKKKEYGQPKLTCTLQLDAGMERVMHFFQPDKKDWYVLKISDSDLYFKVGSWQVKPLLDARREKMVSKQEENKKNRIPQAGPDSAASPGSGSGS